MAGTRAALTRSGAEGGGAAACGALRVGPTPTCRTGGPGAAASPRRGRAHGRGVGLGAGPGLPKRLTGPERRTRRCFSHFAVFERFMRGFPSGLWERKAPAGAPRGWEASGGRILQGSARGVPRRNAAAAMGVRRLGSTLEGRAHTAHGVTLTQPPSLPSLNIGTELSRDEAPTRPPCCQH